MKKIVLALSVVLLGSLAMVAQPQRHHRGHNGAPESPEQGIEMRVERLQKALDLNEGQVAQIKVVLADEMKAMKQMLPAKPAGGEKPDREAMKAAKKQMEELRAGTAAKVRSCLNEEQAAKFDKMQQHMGKHHRHGGPRGKKHDRGMAPGHDKCGGHGKCCGHCKDKAEPAPAPQAD